MKIDRAELTRLTLDGWTLKQLAEHFNAHPTSISRLRTSLGISPKPTMTPERRARIAQMLADGWAYREIQRTEGADMETLRKHFPGQAWTQQQANQHRADTRQARRKVRA